MLISNIVTVLKKIPAPNNQPKGMPRWVDTYTKVWITRIININFLKLWVWGLEEYSKVVYFDADHLIKRRVDDLFEYPEV